MKKIFIIGIALILNLSFSNIAKGHTLVRKGDTLSKIALENKMTLYNLIKLNPQISDPDLIRTGEYIRTSAIPSDLALAYYQWHEIDEY